MIFRQSGFLNVFSNCLLKHLQSHIIGQICMIVLQREFLNVFSNYLLEQMQSHTGRFVWFFSRMNIQMCPQIVYSNRCKVTLTSQMDCLNRFKVLLSEPQYLTHLLLEGGDLGPGAPIATWGPDRRWDQTPEIKIETFRERTNYL